MFSEKKETDTSVRSGDIFGDILLLEIQILFNVLPALEGHKDYNVSFLPFVSFTLILFCLLIVFFRLVISLRNAHLCNF